MFKKQCIAVVLGLIGMSSAWAEQGQTLRIGIEGEYPPFSAVNEQGELYGFDVEIAKALCVQMQKDCTLVQISWDAMIPSLKTNKIDAIVASMSATDERRQSVDFTDKYYSSYGKLVLKDSLAGQINSDNWQEKLQSITLGVQRATIHDRFASEKLKNIVGEIRQYNTQDEVNLDLISGRIDATLADTIALITGFLETDMGKGYAFAEPIFDDPAYYGEGVSIAIRKNEEALKQAFNQAIQEIRANGVYQTINDKYFNVDIY